MVREVKQRPELLTDSSVVPVWEVVEVESLGRVMSTTGQTMGTWETYPEENQDDDDAHDQEAALDCQATLHNLAYGLGNADGTLPDDDNGE